VANGAITGEDIADESVRSADVGGLAGSDVTDGSLGPAEITPESLRGTEVADETIGSAEVAGLRAGDVTSGTFLGGPVTAQFEQNAAELPAGQSTTLTVFCPAGQTAIGGGIRGDASDSEVTTVTGTRPAKSADNTNPPGDGESFTGWRGTVQHNAGSTTTGILPEIWAICAPTP